MAQRHHYALHRWLGAVAALQLIAWSVGGFIFATHDIDDVRGVAGKATAEPPALTLDRVGLSPVQAAARAELDSVKSITLGPWQGRLVYTVTPIEGAVVLVDAADGARLSPIDEATARHIARTDRVAKPAISAAVLVTENPPVEFRGRPLPAWRVDLEDGEGTHIWIDANRGKITARRNDAWRRFDFFWMLHTMDYEDRDDFNHLALILFSISSIATALSGLWLWALRLRRRRRKRRRSAG